MTKVAKTFLLEIGTEELPSSAIVLLQREGAAKMAALFEEAGVDHGEIELILTPRRIAFIVSDVAEMRDATTETFVGPAKNIAYDADGELSKAGSGFLRSKGAEPSQVTFDKQDHLVVTVEHPAKNTQAILEETLPDFIASFPFERTQRWGKEHVRFVRPVRSLVALLGNTPLAITYGDVRSDTHISGHRVLCPEGTDITNADAYKKALVHVHVMDQHMREKAVEEAIQAYEQKEGVSVKRPQASFQEVINLVEWPSLLEASFDETYLQIPQEIIAESLLRHQRYFPVLDKAGNLTQKFIVIGNADPSVNTQVVIGNERVVRARLDDARFFYETDVATGLEALSKKLSEVTFHKLLGSLKQKTERLEALAPKIAQLLGADASVQNQVKRAAHLLKADLVSQTVIEFTNQQGVVGGYLARTSGEDEAVATAISEQYLPRFAGDELPKSLLSTVLSVADKLDTVSGLFAIQEVPSGSRDPFAVRRQSIGILKMLLAYNNFSVSDMVSAALMCYKDQGISFEFEAVKTQVLSYFSTRLEQIAKEEGFQLDVIRAALEKAENPQDFFCRLRALAEVKEELGETFEHLVQAYARAAHLADPALGLPEKENLLTENQKALYQELERVQAEVSAAQATAQYKEALLALASLKDALDTFFDKTLIMDKDAQVKTMNLQMLNAIQSLFETIANMQALSKQEM